ncbi:MAG: SDR family oxidoreductase [Christensenellales bacterium]
MSIPFKAALEGKTAVVTGGAGVLCSGFAKALAECGAKVAVLNRTLERGEKVAQEIRSGGGQAIAVQCDVLSRESVEAAYQKVLAAYGKCDILINGAGGNDAEATTQDEFFNADEALSGGIKSFFDLEEKGIERVMGLNFTGVFRTTQQFAKDMIGRPGGVIINISSMNAYTPLTKIPAYSGAKAAVSNFTQWLAVYFAKAGIRVNAIAPGFFSTSQNAKLLWNSDGSPTKRAEKILNNTPTGRFGVPDDLTGTLLYLVDNACSGFVTGVVIPVDGGFSAYSGV